MKKISFLSVIKVISVNLFIILLSSLIGVSLNKSFIRGPQQTSYEYTRSNGNPVFKPAVGSELRSYPTFESVQLEEVKKVSRESGEIVLLDGRTKQQYENGHIPGAYHLSIADFEKAFPQFSSQFSKETNFVIYCSGSDCSLSRRLAELLRNKSFTQLKIYWGGFNDWFLNGNPVEKGKGKDFLK